MCRTITVQAIALRGDNVVEPAEVVISRLVSGHLFCYLVSSRGSISIPATEAGYIALGFRAVGVDTGSEFIVVEAVR